MNLAVVPKRILVHCGYRTILFTHWTLMSHHFPAFRICSGLLSPHHVPNIPPSFHESYVVLKVVLKTHSGAFSDSASSVILHTQSFSILCALFSCCFVKHSWHFSSPLRHPSCRRWCAASHSRRSANRPFHVVASAVPNSMRYSPFRINDSRVRK